MVVHWNLHGSYTRPYILYTHTHIWFMVLVVIFICAIEPLINFSLLFCALWIAIVSTGCYFLCLFFLLIFFFGLLVISLCFSSFSAVRTPCVHNFITWNHCHCVRAIMELLFSLYYYYYCYERIINAKIENFCIKTKNYLREKCMVDVSGYNNKCRKHNGHNDVV